MQMYEDRNGNEIRLLKSMSSPSQPTFRTSILEVHTLSIFKGNVNVHLVDQSLSFAQAGSALYKPIYDTNRLVCMNSVAVA